MRRAVLVDDERLGRRELRALLRQHPEVEVVGEAETVRTAAEVVHATEADTVFLDIQLGEESGFDLLPRLDAGVAVVFVTAFDHYAVRAFEANAVDYLLKPVSTARLSRALDRLQRPEAEAEEPGEALGHEDFLFLRVDGRMRFVRVRDIRAIEAEGDHTLLHAGEARPLRVRKQMAEWEDRLPASHFVRIHRSCMVSIEHVERVDDWFHASFLVHVRGCLEPFPMSRRYAALLRRRRG